jgi:hypothetical protein
MSSRRTSSEQTALWVVVGLVGLAAAGYAVHLANHPSAEPVAAPQPAVVVQKREPEPLPSQRRGRPQANIPQVQPQLEVERGPEAPVEKVVQAEPAKVAPSADPSKAFEDGTLFDQPTGRDSRGRPGSSSFENPAHGRLSNFERPPQGYSNRRAPNPDPTDRPNRPDPSFGNTNPN